MIRTLVVGVLALLIVLAAASVTALFIFRRPTPSAFATATANEPVRLPRDEAAHLNVQSEWWYYTGFLTGGDDQHYGFELVFFKAYVPDEVRLGRILPLNWLASPLYFAHFALSDPSTEQHVFFEQANVPQIWNAGASSDRYRVRNGDWRAWGLGGEHHLRASAGPYALRLDLDASRPPVLHGPGGSGIVQMGQAGTAYYYSYIDLEGLGLLEIDGIRHGVTATAWMDHQWGSWEIHGGYAGWDWFSLRLDDGTQVMLFDFRNADGSLQRGSGGTWVAADGATQHLTAADFQLEVLERWASPETGGLYPVTWQLAIPDYGVDVNIEATFPNQEMVVRLAPIYWEGSVVVDGSVSGRGFVEMTGYVTGHDQD